MKLFEHTDWWRLLWQNWPRNDPSNNNFIKDWASNPFSWQLVQLKLRLGLSHVGTMIRVVT